MTEEVEPGRSALGWLGWLGTRAFWAIAAILIVLSFGIVASKRSSASSAGALVPVVTITGPSQAKPGDSLRYAVLVRDRYGAPIANADVRVGFWKTQLIELGHATTSDGGDATVEVHFPDDFAEQRTIVALSDVGVAEGADSMLVGPKDPGRASTFVSTDKPMYQPGQTMHIRALTMAGETPIAERPTVVEVRTADGIKVFREEKQSSAFGVVATDFVLADQVKLGSYQIAVTTKLEKAGTASGVRAVDVKRYSLPKLKIAFEDVTPLTAEGHRGRARATWIFGEPVVKGKVTVELQNWSGGNRLAVGVTDKDGVFPFELHWNESLKPKQRQRGVFPLRAKLVVEGGMSSEATAQVSTIDGGDIKLEVFPESGVLVQGLSQSVFVVVTGHEQMENVSIETKDGPPVPISARGIARVTVKPEIPKAGATLMPLSVLAHGDKGGEGKVDLLPVSGALIVRPEDDAFTPGGPVRVKVLGANPGDHVSLRMTKGSEPRALGSCLVEDFEKGCDVTLAVPQDVSGLAWLHAVSLPGGKREVKTGKRLVIVRGGGRDLDLKVTPDHAFYAPRDSGLIDIAVTARGGAPVKAQLGVAVADEAVFQLANVRPDLEKAFFTIDKDIEAMRPRNTYSYGRRMFISSNEKELPPPFETGAAYDPSTDKEVRSTILAVLTTMPDVGAVELRTSSAMSERARATASVQDRRLLGWTLVLLTIYTLLAFLGFALYGWSRFRDPTMVQVSGDDLTAFRRETRALYTDWLIAALGPPGLALAGAILGDKLGGYIRDEALMGTWLILAIFCSVLLVRAVLRVRRTRTAQLAPVLGRAVVFLPIAACFAHFTLVMFIALQHHGLDYFFAVHHDAFFIPLFVVGAAQLTCGALSVIRQTLMREVTKKGRMWLFLSRATFLGLPITLGLGVLLVADHVKRSRVGWDNYTTEASEREQEDRVTEQLKSYSDNKEGGTGTRAKGEEGSMGNPAAPRAASGASGARWAALGSSDEKAVPIHTRDFFPETLLWAPDIITDDTGHAQVRVPFADSITTWRFGLSAVSKAGQLGSTTVPLVVKQDFFVDATLPPTLTQGDEIAMPVTVYSYLPEAQDVTLEVEGAGMSTVGASKTVLHLAARETRGFRFVVHADKAGDRVVRIQATGKTRGDALERKVKVIPNGLFVIRTRNGQFAGAGKTDIELPAGAIDGGNDLFVKVYGGPLSQVAEGLDGVFTMPHGCFEQTSSTTYPSVLALDFLQRTKTVSPEIEKKAKAYIADGYQRLISFEVMGGGFSIFGRGSSSTTLSAYGLLELSDMARVSPVDDTVLRRTRDWLYSQRTPAGGWKKPENPYDKEKRPLQADDVLVTAYVAWAIATSEQPNEKDARLAGVLDVVARASGPDAEEPYALTLRANALLAGGRKADARPLLDRLVSTMIRDDEGVHWTSKSMGVMYSYGQSMDVEVTGLASHALARAEMQPDARSGAISWLVARRGAYGTWSTTQATIAAMRALLDEAKPAPKEPQDITVLVDGESAETYRLEVRARDVHHLVGLRKWATTGKHAIELKASGGADVAYQVVAQHYLPWQKQAAGKPSPLALDVAYSPTTVAAGTLASCRVHLAWRGKEAARMPLIEVGIPPAFEVETSDLDKLVATAEGRIQRYTVERSKVTLYLVELPEDKPLTIDIPLRALRPAKVVVPASEAYLYYEPEVRSETVPLVMRSF